MFTRINKPATYRSIISLQAKQLLFQSQHHAQKSSLPAHLANLNLRPFSTSKRNFSQSVQQGSSQDSELDEIELIQLRAQEIETSIENAKARIDQGIKQGLDVSLEIAKNVPKDKFFKMQRFNIFIAKMEELQRQEKRWAKRDKKVVAEMQSGYLTSQKPLKDLLTVYNKASGQGFQSRLMMQTLEQMMMILRARGNKPRPYEDYSTRDLDISWRMGMMAGHLRTALTEEIYFNHYDIGQSAKLLGQIGYKDVDVIQAYFDKLTKLCEERQKGYKKKPVTINFEKAVYGNYQNFVSGHYIFEGFESNKEFRQHLKTLLEWEVSTNNGLKNLDVEPSDEIMELEQAMGNLISAASTINDLSIDIQASIDSVRVQYQKLQECKHKHEWMNENKFIRLELLEVEEKLVKAGYLLPEEAQNVRSWRSTNVRMQRAAQIFYNYVQNCVPEFMSPTYQEFVKAAHESVDARQNKKPTINLDEEHDKISLSSLSQTLVGLQAQCLSFRREPNDKDYLHKFYEDLALEKENFINSFENTKKGKVFEESQHVGMAREYLKAYKIFERETEKLFPYLKQLIEKSSKDVEGLLYSLHALSVCKYEAPELRDFISKSFLAKVKSGDKIQIRPQCLVDGLKGIALQYVKSKDMQKVAKFCLQKLEKDLGDFPEQKLTFDERLNVMWSASALDLQFEGTIVKKLFQHLQSQNFQRTQNDLTYEQFQMIRDFQLYLSVKKKSKNKWKDVNLNPVLDILAKNPILHEARYPEHHTKFDPFKKRVLLALGQGLSRASIDHEFFTEGHIVSQGDAILMRDEKKLPYPPDIVIGHNGQKVLLEVVTASQAMRDVGKPDGIQRFRHNILKLLNNNDQAIQVVSIPINSVIDYDIENKKVNLNKKYNFLKDINKQLGVQQADLKSPFHFHDLAKFGSNFSGAIANFYQTLKRDSDRQKLDGFLKQLYKVFLAKQHTERQFEIQLYAVAFQKTKFELMKLSILYETIPKHLKQFINSHVPSSQGKTVRNLIEEARKETNWDSQTENKWPKRVDENVDFSWMGTRQEVELPQVKELPFTKSIMPEIINQRFMWVDDYFHYRDWEQKQRQVYDNFNLLIVPRNDGDYKYFYDRNNNQRIVPQGIFPPSKGKRALLNPPVNLYANELEDLQNKGNESVTLFERDPMRYMILKEQQRSSELDQIDEQVGFMTNLQNIKQGLKADYSDKELLDLILGNSKFTDALIKEHLGEDSPESKGRNQPQLLDRDPSEFRQFLRDTYESKDQEDPFSHFYIKEAGKVERVHQVHQEAEERYKKLIEESNDLESRKKAEKLKKTLDDKVIDMLLENKVENDDPTALSHQIDSEIKVTYNLRSLMKSEMVYDIDPELNADDISDQAFLATYRKRAETKIIKAKIIYKQHQGIELNELEQKYLSKWVSIINWDPKINILTVRDSMLPKKSTQLSLANSLKEEDFYALSQVPNVDLNIEEHGQFALSDLILELQHFIDDDFVNRIEQQMISERVKKTWELPQDFQVIETRNKEIGIIINELEEIAWRMSGQFDEKDTGTLKAMFSVARNKDTFDKYFYPQDMKSFHDFIQRVNPYDDRQQFLQEWAIRKEEEWKGRAALPPAHLRKSDEEIHAMVDAKLKKARENLVAKLLEKDGEAKSYNDLTTADLRVIAEQFVIRLALFNGDYPLFVTHIVKGIMDHPNLASSDHSKIKTFCTMFELDWRGDRTIANKSEYMSNNPIYLSQADSSNVIGYGSLGNFEVTAMIRQACVPFVEDLTKKLIESSKNTNQQKTEAHNEKTA